MEGFLLYVKLDDRQAEASSSVETSEVLCGRVLAVVRLRKA